MEPASKLTYGVNEAEAGYESVECDDIAAGHAARHAAEMPIVQMHTKAWLAFRASLVRRTNERGPRTSRREWQASAGGQIVSGIWK